MAWVNDSKNSSSPTNDALLSGQPALTIDDMVIAIDEAEGTIDNPRQSWKRDSANSSTLTNDAKV